MLKCESIDSQIISIADAVRAEIVYDVSMNVNFQNFYKLSFQKRILQEQFLNYNLYKYKV